MLQTKRALIQSWVINPDQDSQIVTQRHLRPILRRPIFRWPIFRESRTGNIVAEKGD